jgi:cytochrome c556
VKKFLLLSLLIPFSVTSFAAGFDVEIEARHDAFHAIEDNVKSVGKMLKSGELDWDMLTRYSAELAKNSSSLKDLFPEGSQGDSRAKAAVWEKNDRFLAGLDKLDGGFQALYVAAQSQDTKAAMAGFKQATGTCKGCHRTFREKE